MAIDNPIYEQRILELDPELQVLCRRLLTAAKELGHDARVIQGYRTFEEQDELYAQGRTKPGPVVTHARGGYSWHNFRKAFDVGLFTERGTYIDDDDSGLMALGEVAEHIGLEWGGRWQHPDYPHFQLPNLENSPTDADRQKWKAANA